MRGVSKALEVAPSAGCMDLGMQTTAVGLNLPICDTGI